jgi:hypothetical protein
VLLRLGRADGTTNWHKPSVWDELLMPQRESVDITYFDRKNDG